jgi:hypothetical protein
MKVAIAVGAALVTIWAIRMAIIALASYVRYVAITQVRSHIALIKPRGVPARPKEGGLP